MGIIEGLALGSLAKWAIGIVSGFVLTWILNAIPKKKINAFFFGVGVTVTVGLSRWRFTKGIWNKTIEPFVIDLLDNILNGFIRGLKSDNK